MQISHPQKKGVPRVPRVPKLLKALYCWAYKAGTQNLTGWNTLPVIHQRCSTLGSACKQNLLSANWWIYRYAKCRPSRFVGHTNGAGGEQ